MLIIMFSAHTLVVSRAFFLIHSRALLFLLHGAMLIIMFGAHTLVTYRAFLHIQCVADLFHLRLALLLLHSATLLFVRSAALVLMGCHGLVLSVTVPVRLLGHVRCIHDLRQQYHSQASKYTNQAFAVGVHLLSDAD